MLMSTFELIPDYIYTVFWFSLRRHQLLGYNPAHFVSQFVVVIGTGYSKLMIYFDSIFQAKPEDSASDKY